MMVLNFPQINQRPRRERVQLQEVRQGSSQAAQSESTLLHPGRPAARLLQVGDVTSPVVDDGIGREKKNPLLESQTSGQVNCKAHLNISYVGQRN